MTSHFADILMLLHFLWVTFMVVGLPLGLLLKSPTLRWIHFFGMTVTASIAVAGIFCPLTIWEEQLRRVADPSFSFEGSFLARHLGPILYPDMSPKIIMGLSVMWGALTVAAMVIWKPGKERGKLEYRRWKIGGRKESH